MAVSPAIQAFAAKQNEFNTRMEASIQGIGGDIDGLNALIRKLQDSSGAISAEDQATLDELQTKGDALATKFESLDALTPPATPTAE